MRANDSNVRWQCGDQRRSLVTMQLHGVEADLLGDFSDLIRRVVDEDADFENFGRQCIRNQSRLLRLDKPSTFVKEIQAERIGSGTGSRKRIIKIRNAANLNPERHAFIIRRAEAGGLA
jgi:hypothetical protein